jgi:hypothetical protein
MTQNEPAKPATSIKVPPVKVKRSGTKRGGKTNGAL